MSEAKSITEKALVTPPQNIVNLQSAVPSLIPSLILSATGDVLPPVPWISAGDGPEK